MKLLLIENIDKIIYNKKNIIFEDIVISVIR